MKLMWFAKASGMAVILALAGFLIFAIFQAYRTPDHLMQWLVLMQICG